MGIGWSELLLIFLVVLLIFGAKRIPEIARSLGQAANEFKKAKDGVLEEPKTAETKPADAKPAEAKPAESKDGGSKPA